MTIMIYFVADAWSISQAQIIVKISNKCENLALFLKKKH